MRYLTEVTAFTRHLTESAADGDDLLQSTYEQAFRSWRSLRDPAACRPWLFRIARNLRIDALRSRSARPELLSIEDESEIAIPSIAASSVEHADAVDLHRALARLPREQREAVLLCDLWGFRYEEIAAIVDVPVGTVRSRISRARARMLAVLSGASIQRERR